MEKILYAAYGSNINVGQMNYRCPDASIFGRGTLEGYRLDFCRVANIFKVKDSKVPVLLWELSKSDEQKLDKFEGVPHKYHKEYLDVKIGGDTYKALVYVMNGMPLLDAPQQSYYERIEDGYVEAKFDVSILEAAEERAISFLDKKYQTYSIFDKDYQNNVKNHNNSVKEKSKGNAVELIAQAFTLGQHYEAYGLEDISDKDKATLLQSVRKSFQSSGYDNFGDFCTDYFDALYDYESTYELVADSSIEKESDQYIRYIAYGSNINVGQMNYRCPQSKVVGVGTLEDYELKFNGCATIKKSKGAETPVLVWDIHIDDWKALDRYEGYPSYYRRENVAVTLNGKKEEATVYIMNCDDKAYSRPSPSYYRGIEEGYTANGMDLAPLEKALSRAIIMEKQRKMNETKRSR